jgi:hypothetical protein
MCICDETAGKNEVLVKFMKNFTEHIQECTASEEAHLLQSSCQTQNFKACKIITCKPIPLTFLMNE